MSQQIQITGGAKVRNLEGVLTGTSGVVNALGINVPDGIPQLDGSGKILVSQLPNSVMEYKGTWNASTNTPTLADGTGNAGDVYVCSVAGTVNFGSGPIVFYVGDQVLYSGTTWQRASGSSGSVTSVAVTESGDALTITGSPITTSGTINIGFAGTTGQYVNGAGGLTTFPTDNITGSGASGQVTYFNGTNTITSESSFNYDASTNRLGVNTSVPNATIGANAGTDSGYSLLLKNDNANYNGIGFGTDSTYGNLIATEKLGTATSKNLTLLNQSGYISLTETGNLGLGILNPNTGLDIYNGTSAYLWLHTANSGITGSDGVRLALFSNNSANLRNTSGALSITAEGDFSIITIGAENFKVNSADGSIYQSKVANAMLKSVSGVITAAVAGTDYLAPSSLSAYVPYTGATTNVNLGTHSLTAADLVINHTSGSGVAASITKGGSGEALTVVKSSGSGNAASITGGITLLSELNLTTALADAYIASAATWNAKMGGSGVSGRVAYYNGTNSITSQSGFIYDSSSNRLGVNTVSPNATIGANAPTDSIYSLLLKNGDNNYSGIGFATSSVYGNTIETVRLGTAPSRNLTLYNYAGYVSITEAGNLGVNILTPNNGIDIYHSTQSQLWLHNNATGVGATDGVRLALFNNKNANLINFDGALSLTAEGDFQIITIGAENLRVNSANGYIGIGNPATVLAPLHVYNAENAASLLLQTDGSTSYSEIAVRNASSVATSYFRQYSASASGTDFGLSRANLATFFSNYASNFAIGTQNGGALILGTANEERMRIATDGNVAIGTSTTGTRKVTIVSASPAEHLHLISNAPSLTLGNALTATYFAIFGMATASNNFITGAVAGDLCINTNSANSIYFGNSNTSTQRMRLTGGGDLGIGTGSPDTKLDVRGEISLSYSASNGLRFYNQDRSNWSSISNTFTTTNANLVFRTAAGVALTLESTRDATFTTNIAAQQGTFSSSVTATGVIGVQGTNQNFIRLSPNAGGAGFSIGRSLSDNNAQDFFIYDGIANATRLFINSSGNVGIGTSSPTGQASDNRVIQIYGAGTANRAQLHLCNSNTGEGTSDGTFIGVDSSTNLYINNAESAATIFENGGSERMRITSGGDVLVGLTSSTYSTTNRTSIVANGTSTALFGLVVGGVNKGYFYSTGTNILLMSEDASGYMSFGTANAERMRITSGGNVLIGTTSGSGTLSVYRTNSGDTAAEIFTRYSGDLSTPALYLSKFDNNSTTSQVFVRFAINNVGATNGQINANGANQAAFGSWSDARLKDNITDLPSQLHNIMSLRPVEFDYKNGSGHQIGFIAQEMQEIYSDAVGEDSDGFLTITGWSKTEARLVKAIQELQERIVALESK